LKERGSFVQLMTLIIRDKGPSLAGNIEVFLIFSGSLSSSLTVMRRGLRSKKLIIRKWYQKNIGFC
jgi:hypothetical protein